MRFIKKSVKRIITIILVLQLIVPLIPDISISAYVLTSRTTLTKNPFYPDWYMAIIDEGYYWGDFHRAVQKDIVNKCPGVIAEKKIIYSNGSWGRTDLRKKNAKKVMLWEIKPARYGLDEEAEQSALNQLQTYVDSDEKYVKGDGNTIKSGTTFLEKTKNKGFFSLKTKYRIEYQNAMNGLILYHFDRVNVEIIPEPGLVPVWEWEPDGVTELSPYVGELTPLATALITSMYSNPVAFETFNSAFIAFQSKVMHSRFMNSLSEQLRKVSIALAAMLPVMANFNAVTASADEVSEINNAVENYFGEMELYDEVLCNKVKQALLNGNYDEYYTLLDELLEEYKSELEEAQNASSNSSSSLSDDSSAASSESSSESSEGGSQTSDSVAKNDLTSQSSEESEAEGAACDPLILDLNDDGYDINTKGNGSYFDLNCDNFAEKINWTTKDGILALDKNNNGTIDNGNEVFGDYFIMENGDRAINGFDALKQFDNNADDVIDNNDAIFEKLLIWIDENGNGKTESGELSSVKDNNISKIHLDYVSINQITDSEAIIGNQSIFEYTDSSTGNIGEMWVSADLFDALELISMEPSKEIAGLPNVRSFGTVNSLHIAMMNDSSGKLQSLVRLFTTEKNYSVRTYIVKQILEIMCNAEGVDSASRGSYIDAKHLAVIEAVMGKTFTGQNGVNPNRNAATILEQVYNNIVNTYCFAMLSSTVYDYIDRIEIIENQDGSKNYQMNDFNLHLLQDFESGEIDYGTFLDICSYVDYFSKVEFGDRRLLICLLEYIFNNYRDLYEAVFPAIYDSINGTSDSDFINGTDKDDFIISGDGDDTVYGKNGNDYLIGNNGEDTLYGESNDDYLIGGCGNDELYGQLGNDQLYGEDGDDKLYGSYGNDVIDGGAGTDWLDGGKGDDIYIFGRGYGEDTIWEGNYDDNDRVKFKNDITPDDIILSREDDSMILSIKDTNDRLIISNVYRYNCHDQWVELFEFADGTVKTIQDYFDTPLTITGEGTIEDFRSYHGTRDAILIGSDNDDIIYGYSGNDIIDGKKGNDKLYGGENDDTYIFGRGYGNDTIWEGSVWDNDKIIFKDDISPDDIIVSRDGENSENLTLHIKDSDDSISILSANAHNCNDRWVETFEFADGTIKTIQEYFDTPVTITGEGEITDNPGEYCTNNSFLIGSDNDDSIYGRDGNDTLDGKGGNDWLDGGKGDDIYIFGRGYGEDTIWEGSVWDKNDKIVFKEDITPEDIILSREDDNMILSIKDTNDRLIISNVYRYKCYDQWVEFFEFDDGTVKTIDDYFAIPVTITGEGTIKDFSGYYGTRDAILIGSDGDDTIYGYYGNDTLDGRGGDDRLEGYADNDTYIFGIGYGHDTILEGYTSKSDKVIFGDGISPDDIIVTRENDDMTLLIKDTNDSLTIIEAYKYGYDVRWVETFEFADGTIKTIHDYLSTPLTITGEGKICDFSGGYGTRDATLIGSDGDDTIYGYYGNDILDGRGGDDRLEGYADNDTYIFGLGYGHDTILEAYTSENDKIIFRDGITPENLSIAREDNNLVISVNNTEDSITIINYYVQTCCKVETFEFSDGTVAEIDAATSSFVIVKEGSGINNPEQSDNNENEDAVNSESENETTETVTETESSSSEADIDEMGSEGSSADSDQDDTNSTNDMSFDSTDDSESNSTSNTKNETAA